MPFNRRPIQRQPYSWTPEPKGPSLRFDLILDGAVRKYPDGREVCQDNPQGLAEFARRLGLALSRQHWQCCSCDHKIKTIAEATFELRGDHRIYDGRGQWLNRAVHSSCRS
jgi:hypothetical protein